MAVSSANYVTTHTSVDTSPKEVSTDYLINTPAAWEAGYESPALATPLTTPLPHTCTV